MKTIIVIINYREKIQIKTKTFDKNKLNDIKIKIKKYIAFVNSN